MYAKEFKLKPSKWYLGALIWLVLGTACMFLTLPFTGSEKGAALVLLILYGAHLVYHHGLLRGKQALLTFKRNSDHTWQIKTQHARYQATLAGDSAVTRFVSVLRFKVDGIRRPFNCVVFYDALDPDSYHALLMLVKLSPLPNDGMGFSGFIDRNERKRTMRDFFKCFFKQ